MKTNSRVKDAMRKNHVAIWQIADYEQVSESTMVRKFRHEMPITEQDELLAYIKRASKENAEAKE